MFEVGRLVARILIEGKQVAKSDLNEVGAAFDKTATSARTAATEHQKAGTALTGTGAKARTAATELEGARSKTEQTGQAAAKAATETGKLDKGLTDAASAARDQATATYGSADSTEKLGEALGEAGERAQDTRPKVRGIRDELAGLSDEGKRAASEVGSAFIGLGVGITAFAGLAVARFADFDRSMSQVAAATLAPQNELAKLRDAALEAGATSKYSATEAAQGITELSKAGVSTAAIIGGGLAGSLALAAAGEIEVADAAETAATAMTQFGLAGDKIPHLADLLAAGAGKAQGGVSELSMALKQSGLVASQMGLSVEDTVGTLTAFASAGLLGSDAGTSFKTMLLSLANPSKESAQLMKELGINAYNTRGEFVGVEEVAGQLTTAFQGKTQAERDSALATIFGSDAIRAANVLYIEGADGIREWTENVNDAGYASRQAAELQNNLAGDVEKLGGAFDTALIQAGSGANDVLREMVQYATSLVGWFGALPAPVLSTGVAIAGMVGGFLILGGTILTTATKVGEFRANLARLNEEMPKTARGATAAAKGLGLIAGLMTAAVVLDAIFNGGMKAAAGLEETAKAMRKLDGLDDLFANLDGATDVNDLASALQLLTGNDLNSNLERFASQINQAFGGQFGDQVQQTRDQFAAVDQSLAALVEGGNPEEAAKQFSAIAAAAKEQGVSTEQLMNEILPGYAAALSGTSDVQGEATAATADSAQAYLDQADGVQQAVDKLNELLSVLNEVNAQNQTAIEANSSYQASLAATQEQVAKVTAGEEGYARGLDLATEAGRSNMAVLLDQTKASQDAAQKQYELDAATMGTTEATNLLKGRLEEGRQKLIDNAIALGATADEAQALADKIYGIPSEKDFTLASNLASEIQAANNMAAAIRNIPGYKEVVINQQIRQTGADPGAVKAAYGNNGMMLKSYANGGYENHVAQIAKAGTWRVWAEDETGGETYIPHALSKRAKSTEYLGYTADLFGYDLVPKDAQRMANGGATASVGAATSALGGGRPVYIGEFLIGWMTEQARGAVIDLFEEQKRQARDIYQRNGFGRG